MLATSSGVNFLCDPTAIITLPSGISGNSELYSYLTILRAEGNCSTVKLVL